MNVKQIIAVTLFTLGATGFVAFSITRMAEGQVACAILVGYAMGVYANVYDSA